MSRRWSTDNNDIVYITVNYPAHVFRRLWRRIASLHPRRFR